MSTQYLTFVNVTAALPGKRKIPPAPAASSRDATKRDVRPRLVQEPAAHDTGSPGEESLSSGGAACQNGAQATLSTYETCFGSTCGRERVAAALVERDELDSIAWTSQTLRPTGQVTHTVMSPNLPHEELRQLSQGQGAPNEELPKTWDQMLEAYFDVADCSVSSEQRPAWRRAAGIHAVKHVQSIRRRVIRNNERLAHAAANDTDVDPDSVRDQGFTRPKVLILAPFRNSAIAWLDVLAEHSSCTQFEQRAKFRREFTLPDGAIDRLAEPSAAQRFPADHIETFSGNIDDSFCVGMKLTRKSLKVYSGFYDSDFILASPLGLRLAVDKENSSDFLSSIEVLVIDQAEVMLMQNWEHVKFAISSLNNIPKEAHDTDFSRVKQWYLDDRARMFRQTLVSSRYPFPQLLKLLHKDCTNLVGKGLITRLHAPAIRSVRTGVRQSFVRFECASAEREADLRFKAFTTRMLPNLLRSAVSAKRMLVLVPSYFDFLRLEQHLRTLKEETFAAVSEYSSNKQIARAREAFFSGRRSILVMTERFHFYKRYRIRGCQTLVFYGLPENASFYSEILEFPFIAARDEDDDTEKVDPSDVRSEALFCRYDLMRLQRIVGPEAVSMTSGEKSVWKWA